MTDAERYQRAKSLFLDLVALPASERAAALARECAGDGELRAEVESLLAHAGPSEGDAPPLPGVTVGNRHRFATGDLFADRYRIVAEIGRGSAGEVYRAIDERLGVEIALKILHRSSPAAIRRLVDEVRLARQISDPAICRVYDIEEADGEYFLTMELVDGENLASLLARVGRLSGEKVRAIGVELCRGLAAAHERGVLHRDLKPCNVMLDGAGAVRLTDFGVAALEDAAETAPLAGTLAYMAPEQLNDGAPASVKTDLYAVGLILYEALVGGPPVDDARDDNSAVAPAHVRPPSALAGDVDARLEAIVMSLIATRPADRPDSAAEAAARLAALASTDPTAGEPRHDTSAVRGTRIAFATVAVAAVIALAYVAVHRLRVSGDQDRPDAEQVVDAAGAHRDPSEAGVAVLPIADESTTHDQGYLAEGIQDRIMQRLAAIRGLRVIAEESIDRYGSAADARVVASELGLDFVAVGSIRGDGESARIDLALHDGKTGKRVWTESHVYGTTPARALEVDRDVAEQLVARLRLDAAAAITPAGSATTPDTPTYSLYLRGREHVPPFSRREFESSVDLLKQVIERAPAFAPAYAAIATAYVTASALRWVDPKDGYPTARRYADRAIALDPSLAEAHVALALIAGEYDWDWRAAEASYARALELSPGSAWTYRSFARFLATQGRFEDSLAATRRALALDPTSALMAQGAAQRFYDARQYDRAVAMARLAVRLDPINPYSYPTLAFALLEQGAYAEAIAQLEKAMVVAGVDATGQARLAYALSRAGDHDGAAAAAAATRRIGTPDSLERALLAIAEGDEAAAVSALGDAVAARAPPSIWLAVSRPLDPLREREDFRALVAKVGLPDLHLATTTAQR
jgi:eukaryotic-like serine/threonine-protein kinase